MSARERWTLIAAVLGSSIVFVDSSVVTVALPRIGRELPTTVLGVLEGQLYVYTGYLLTLSALLVLAGALSDYYGRRRIFLIGLVGFGLTSVLCGVAPNMEFLVLSRVLQGAAGAILVPGSLALLTANFSGEAQGRAYGVWAAATAATTILGPFIGGILVDTISWRVAFLINVPLVIVAVWATLQHVPESRNERATGHFDWLGAAVVAIAVGGLSFGATYGQQRDWRDPLAYVVLAAGVVATIAFPFLMARSREPLVPLDLFRSRNFTVTNISTFLIYGALYVSFYYLALFLQGVLGYSAAAAGLAGIPGGLLLVLLSTRFGALSARYGPKIFMTVGPLLMAIGVLWFARVPATSPAWVFMPGNPSTWVPPGQYFIDFLPAQIIFGFGLALMVAPLTTALMTSVPVRNSGVASAVNNAISRVGPQLAGAVIFVAITASFYSGMAARLPGTDTSDPSFRTRYPPLTITEPCLTSGTPTPCPPEVIARVEAVRQQSTEAFHLAMYVAAALLFAGALVNAVGISNDVALAAAKREPAPAA
ncbi:MAG: DHA2 family efflux MFS transporter permease subunit [Chloroflexi bacterium]|nr:MAG: DHA2 family efflux MFS transporter permease subunit [Chloroflexota bacterium]